MESPKVRNSVLQLHIQLQEVEPTVWRRVLVPLDVKLPKLHSILQTAMGWSDTHLHAFQFSEGTYGPLDEDDDFDEDQQDETSVTIADALGEDREFLYDYDFGDEWGHLVSVEEILPQEATLKFAVCVEGENACPPEDVGGPMGYAQFLVDLADPESEVHADLMEWIGGPFDPEFFDVATVNVALQRIR